MVIVTAACLGMLPAMSAADEAPLRVSVAVSLRPAIGEAAPLFRSARGVDILLNSGGSGVLLQQVRRGAPGDLLISASHDEIERLVAEKLAVRKTRRTIASNRLVLVVPVGERIPGGVEELVAPEFERIVVGNPRTAPLGRYTAQALRALGLWDALEPRLVYAENARYALDYVARGEVSAALVYRTDARLMPGRVAEGPEVPSARHEVMAYEGVVLTEAARPAEAEAFLAWLADGAGSEVLRRHGFLPPPAIP